MTDTKTSALPSGTPVAADLFSFVKVADHATAPAGAGGSNQVATFLSIAKLIAQRTFGKALVPANNFCAGDGVTDDTAGMEAAIAAVFAGAGLGLGGVYCPDQYLVTASLNCTSATLSAAGQGVTLVGADRDASQIIKDFNGPLITYNGNGGSDGNHSAFGGLRDITLNGGGKTGALLQTNSAQQMFFENVSYISNPDVTLDLNTMEDSYWVGCTSNNCGSTTADVINITGSANGSSNMLWFTQLRVEAFARRAVSITQGTGGSVNGGNNGFFFSQCKFETNTVHGDLFFADGFTQQLVMDQIFFALDAFASGFSTPANCVTFGDGTLAAGSNQFSLTNSFAFSAPGVLNSVVNVNGASGAMNGPVKIASLMVDATPVTAAMVFNGVGGLDVSWDAVDSPGTLVGGDGSYYNPNSTTVALLGSALTLQGSLPAATAAPALGGYFSGVGIGGNTHGTGQPLFGVMNNTEDGSGGGIGTSAFVVNDNDTAYHRGVVAHAGGTDTSTTATASTPTFTSGTAKTLSTTQDVMLYIAVKTSISVTLAIGSTSSAATSIVPVTTLPVGAFVSVRIPKGWFVKLTCATMGDLQLSQVTC